MITYEVESSVIKFERVETDFWSWLSEIGGFWAFFVIFLQFFDQLEDVQLFVISDLIKKQISNQS